MGKVTRKRYAADFKATVALEAIRSEQTLAELLAKHSIHQTMIAVSVALVIWFSRTLRAVVSLCGVEDTGA